MEVTAEVMTTEAQEALLSAQRAGLVKKLNAASWSNNMETLMKSWGEKAAGLRFMHNASAGSWKNFSNKLTLVGITISAFGSALSLAATSIDEENTKNYVMYGVGAMGLVASFVQTLKKFYNAEEKSAEHNAIAKQFGSFYRYMTLQLGMAPEDRRPADQLSEWALKEYERLQQDAPNIGGDIVALYKNTFIDSEQAIPDICESKFTIKIYENN